MRICNLPQELILYINDFIIDEEEFKKNCELYFDYLYDKCLLNKFFTISWTTSNGDDINLNSQILDNIDEQFENLIDIYSFNISHNIFNNQNIKYLESFIKTMDDDIIYTLNKIDSSIENYFNKLENVLYSKINNRKK